MVMNAILAREPGGPEVLGLTDQPRPMPDDAILVRVACAGVNFADVLMRRGESGTAFPFIPGVKGAGTVEATGQRVAWGR
jgi:NADPH2:quinone reductase